MTLKILVLASLLNICHLYPLEEEEDVLDHHSHITAIHGRAPTHYDFKYSVDDAHTGDSKTQEESRRGNLVQGSYSVIEPDGSKRIVDYIADPKNGFNAVVRKEYPTKKQGLEVKTPKDFTLSTPFATEYNIITSIGQPSAETNYLVPGEHFHRTLFPPPYHF